MKLDNFKNSPMSIVSYIILTTLFSYLILGNVSITITTTILSIWIFMMPRLTYENSTYQRIIPKFLKKGDIINKIISWLIPIVLWFLYAVSMQTKTIFENPLLGMMYVLMPIVPAGIQYLIIKNADSVSDWIGPFVMAILTFFGTEFIAGNIGTTVKTMFPFFFGETIVITQLWCILFEILFIYSFYKIVSFILPARTVMSFITTFCFVFISMLQTLYATHIGVTFKLTDIFNIKQFVATLKLLFITLGTPVETLAKGFAIIAFITVVVAIINKWATIYDFKERAKGLLVGVIVLAICTVGIIATNNYAKENNLPIYKGQVSVLTSEITQKNQFSEDFQNKLNIEIDNLGWGEEKKESNNLAGVSYDDWTVENAQQNTVPATTIP